VGAQRLINALTGHVGPGTQVTGYPTYQELRPALRFSRSQMAQDPQLWSLCMLKTLWLLDNFRTLTLRP
jgi:hypothetical protein